MAYKTVPDGYKFSSTFPTWIIAFCPDSDSWFVTNKRFFYFEYSMEFQTEQEGIDYFKANPIIFYDLEIKMGINSPWSAEESVFLENTNETIYINRLLNKKYK